MYKFFRSKFYSVSLLLKSRAVQYLPPDLQYICAEDGKILTTESGLKLITED